MIISILNMKSVNFRKIMSGKPAILIYRGRIDEKALRKESITINELQERLRVDNIFNLGDVEYAILETNGEVTVIQKPEKRNIIVEDLNIKVCDRNKGKNFNRLCNNTWIRNKFLNNIQLKQKQTRLKNLLQNKLV